jgi:hypothetical protein
MEERGSANVIKININERDLDAHAVYIMYRALLIECT